ncbi:unnamed protein product [Acanthosepion pharaonis]|uniref:Uncharacterized protein n=1 Tax=Acanthosepion pharaonis TaxID=158019 RepID=A0A812B962_ACAPH|nr:unnamed protein product [Sepia pharaonis]
MGDHSLHGYIRGDRVRSGQWPAISLSVPLSHNSYFFFSLSHFFSFFYFSSLFIIYLFLFFSPSDSLFHKKAKTCHDTQIVVFFNFIPPLSHAQSIQKNLFLFFSLFSLIKEESIYLSFSLKISVFSLFFFYKIKVYLFNSLFHNRFYFISLSIKHRICFFFLCLFDIRKKNCFSHSQLELNQINIPC